MRLRFAYLNEKHFDYNIFLNSSGKRLTTGFIAFIYNNCDTFVNEFESHAIHDNLLQTAEI